MLASEYPRDVGIESDPAVILVERFNDTVAAISNRLIGTTTTSAGFVTEPTATKGQSFNTAAMTIPVDAPTLSPGTTCLQMSATGGGVTQGTFFHNLGIAQPAGYTELYVRYYVQYPAGGTRHHNGLWILGQNPASNFLPSTTGRPTGADWFHTAMEPEHPLNTLGTTAYTAWMDMHPLADGITYVSNTFDNVTLTAGQWYCIEIRVKMNSPTSSSNGELQVWIDDVELFNLTLGSPLGVWAENIWTTGGGATPFEGFRWRSTTNLAINGLWFNHFSDFNGGGVTTTMRWSHLVVATERIGALTVNATLPLAAGSYAVTGTAATLTSQAIHSWLRRSGGVSEIGSSLVQGGNIYVNGQAFFPFGFYHVSWSAPTATMANLIEDVQWMGANGFNVVFAPQITTFAEWLAFADIAHAAGVMLICEDIQPGDRPALAAHPAHFANPTGDDINYPCGAPPPGLQPPDVINEHNAFKVMDPNHLTYMSGGAHCALQGTSNVAYMNPHTSDLFGQQSYPIGAAGHDPNGLLDAYTAYRNAVIQAEPYGVPIIANTQCFDWSGQRLPTVPELTCFTYGAIIAGVKGIIYYAYYDVNVDINSEPTMQAEFVLQGPEIQQLAPVLVDGVRTPLATGWGDVVAAQWVHQGIVYIIVANLHTTTARAATVYIPGVISGTATPLFAGRPSGMTYASGVLTGTVTAQQVHVYTMPANASPPPASAISYIGSANSGTAGTTSFSVTLPTTQSGDIILLEFNHRGTGNGTIGGTYTSSTLVLKHSQLYGGSGLSCKTYWSRATGNHAGQTMTATGLTNSCGAIVTIYRGALATGDPLTGATVVGEENAVTDETLAETTTTVDDCMVVLVVGATGQDYVMNLGAAKMGMLIQRVELRTAAAVTVSITHGSAPKAVAGATGGFAWYVPDRNTAAWAYAIKPA